MKRPTMIFTVGYSGLAPTRLKRIAEALDADVIDCRFKPTSRNASYRQGPLRALLGERYIWAGDKLGGMGHVTGEGLKFIKDRKRNSILMCMCHAPGDCHRHMDITKGNFPNAIHIFEDELILEADLAKAIDEDLDVDLLGTVSDDVFRGNGIDGVRKLLA
jgi:hypothetical protein